MYVCNRLRGKQNMADKRDLEIEKSLWDNLPSSSNLEQRDDIERRAREGTLIIKNGEERYRPVEIPEAGWQLEKVEVHCH